jgi:hypothetical protein
MLEKQTLLKGALILVISLAVLTLLAPAVAVIDTTGMPSWEIQVVAIVQHFFVNTPWALLGGFAWSLFGFLRYNFGDTTVQFETDKLYITWMWFEGILVIVAAGFPTPIAMAITGIIMAVKSVFNQLKAQSTITAAGPGPPKP